MKQRILTIEYDLVLGRYFIYAAGGESFGVEDQYFDYVPDDEHVDPEHWGSPAEALLVGVYLSVGLKQFGFDRKTGGFTREEGAVSVAKAMHDALEAYLTAMEPHDAKRDRAAWDAAEKILTNRGDR